MPAVEDRMAALERKVAAMELERSNEHRKASERTPSEHAYNFKEINHNLTMLLGLADGHEEVIRAMQGDLGVLKEHVEHIDRRLDKMDRRFDGIDRSFAEMEVKFDKMKREMDRRFDAVDQRFVSLEEKFEQRFTSFEQRFTSMEGKFDQVLQQLTILNAKLE